METEKLYDMKGKHRAKSLPLTFKNLKCKWTCGTRTVIGKNLKLVRGVKYLIQVTLVKL